MGLAKGMTWGSWHFMVLLCVRNLASFEAERRFVDYHQMPRLSRTSFSELVQISNSLLD